MEHFKGINETERYNNDLLNELRKQTALLERIAQTLDQKPEAKQDEQAGKRPYTRRK